MIPQFSPGPRGKALMEQLWQHLEENGRNRESFGIEAQVGYNAGPEKWAEHADSWKDLGARYVCVRTMDAGLHSPAEHITALDRYAREVGVQR